MCEQAPTFCEEDCETALFRAKWPDGFRCPRCGGTRLLSDRFARPAAVRVPLVRSPDLVDGRHDS
ncbi:transposase [Cohnella rhizosphaerae]|uniref:transposase n=1 Tax=Cohnella rhizosphaerae TaxID=1457232 RepID=UPI003B8A8B3F